MNIAIIPARGGSKRIPQKNIKKFYDYPIIYYSIKAAIESKLFSKIICSTDSAKIASIAKKYGAYCPFIRPKKLSNDYASTLEVIKHSVNYLEREKINFENICCIYPTAPFIKSKNIKIGYKKLLENKYKFVFSASKSPISVYRSFSLNNKKRIKLINNKDFFLKRSQDLRDAFFDAGQFYWANKNTWKKYKKIFTKNSTIVEVPFHEAIDINTQYDWNLAKKLYKNFNEKIFKK